MSDKDNETSFPDLLTREQMTELDSDELLNRQRFSKPISFIFSKKPSALSLLTFFNFLSYQVYQIPDKNSMKTLKIKKFWTFCNFWGNFGSFSFQKTEFISS